MQVSFILRKDKVNKDGLIPVRMLITVNGERIRRNIKNVKTKLKDWKNQRVKPNLKNEPYNFHIEFNKELDEFENKAKLIFRQALLNNIKLSKDFILSKLDSDSFNTNSISPDFFTSFHEFIETNRNTKALTTTKKYITALNFIRAFENETNYKITLDSLNIEFYEKFRDYAFEKRNTLNNYFGKIIAGIKTFMNWSFERGYHKNLEYKKFKAIQNNIEVIYLTKDELMKLYDFPFESKRLEYVRDFYCFGCFTGLRFSDIKQLKISNVFDDYIKLNIQKSKTIDHIIPLNKFAKAILNKYIETLYEPLPTISGQKFNQYIKECCKIIGINTPTNITRYIGNRRIDKVLPKYELITSHTARKTFVTNSLVLGMKEMVVKNITGHKDDKSFRKYVEIAENFKKEEMDIWNKI
jgi:integrase